MKLEDLQGTQPASAPGVGVQEPCLGSARVCCLKKLASPPGLRLLCLRAENLLVPSTVFIARWGEAHPPSGSRMETLRARLRRPRLFLFPGLAFCGQAFFSQVLIAFMKHAYIKIGDITKRFFSEVNVIMQIFNESHVIE